MFCKKKVEKLFFKKKEWNEHEVQMIEVQDFVFPKMKKKKVSKSRIVKMFFE